jgi:hypothetical protein
VLFISLSDNPTPFKGGLLKPVPSILELNLVTGAPGSILLPFLWPTGIPSGISFYFQYAIADAAAVQGVALSNALKGTTP